MREYIRQTIAGFSSGAMPRWQRWLCGIILTLAAPIWIPALVLTAVVLATQDLVAQLSGKGGRS